MKSALVKIALAASAFLTASIAQADLAFFCSNQPLSKWQNYFVVQGTFSNPDQLFLYQFGIVEGSAKAQEMEPVNTVEDLTVRHNPKLAASSAAWKNAKSFDLTTKELGAAVLYLHMDSVKVDKAFMARLKVDKVDVRLNCSASN